MMNRQFIKKLIGSCIIAFVFVSFAFSQYIRPVDLFESGTKGVVEFRIPSMITCQTGAILAVCDARVERAGDVPNNIDQVIRRSLDNGQTWEEVRTIVNFVNQEVAADPQLVQDAGTGRVFLFYTYCPGRNNMIHGPNRNRRYLSLQYIFSDDDGITWSLPLVVEHGLKKQGWHSMWPAPGRGTQLTDGRLIIPITVSDTTHMYSYFIYSDDHGDNWNISGKIGTNINEPTLVEIDRNNLLVNARNRDGGKRGIVISEDKGESWSEIIFHDELIEPDCQGSCIRVKTGDSNILLFSNPEHPKQRRNMTVKLSYDNGKTWPQRKTIYEGPSAYSCLNEMPDGEIGLMYEHGKDSPYEKISFVKFPIDWITKK